LSPQQFLESQTVGWQEEGLTPGTIGIQRDISFHKNLLNSLLHVFIIYAKGKSTLDVRDVLQSLSKNGVDYGNFT